MTDIKRADAQGPHFLSRRDFTTWTAAVAVASSAGAAHASIDVVETDVTVKTPDGDCDAVLSHPVGKGPWPAVILYSDAYGLRPFIRDLASRLASEGFTVLAPNIFYRDGKAPTFSAALDLGRAADAQAFAKASAKLTQDAVMRDAAAHVAFLDKQSSAKRGGKVGVVGYCLSGPMVLQTAAAVPDRIAAGAAFHSVTLTSDKPDSPHLLAPKIKGAIWIAFSEADYNRDMKAKGVLETAFAGHVPPARINVEEGTLHGWCMGDTPRYSPRHADATFHALVEFHKQNLA